VPPVFVRGRRLLIAGAVGILTCSGLATASTAHAATPRTAIPDTEPTWATASNATPAPAATTGIVNARIYLAGVNSAGLSAYATAASTPGNPLYRHYLTPAQVQAGYGPTTGQVAAIQSWIQSAGLTVTAVERKVGGYVSVTGSLSAATAAFGVHFGMFRSTDGQAYRAPEQEATAPSDLASSILTISGLDTEPHLMKPLNSLPPPGPNYWVAPPCGQYYGQLTATDEPKAYGSSQPWTVCGYTQAQVRSAYGVSPSGMTGEGQTVAIVDAYASPTMPGDANKFATATGDKPFRAGQFEQVLPSSYTSTGKACGPAGWYGEETLDIEAVHGQAPDANVVYVGAASCNDSDLIDALSLIVDDHLASIVSDSWGGLEDQDTSEEPVFDLIFRAGAAEGIGVFFASGDNGYESPAEDPLSDRTQVDFPPSDPWVTAVGGTSLAIGAQGNYEFETSWGTVLDPLTSKGKSWQYPLPGKYPHYYDGSGGGGTSVLFAQPSYQVGVVPASLSRRLPDGKTSPTPMREVPDVSALADPSTGMLVGQTTRQPNGKTYAFSLSRIGGTSVACPTFAGIEADAQQAAGAPLGFANPAIYQRYGTTAFHDVTDNPLGTGHLAEVRTNFVHPSKDKGATVTYLRTLGIDGEGASSLPAVKGYDDATGVGSPNQYIESFLP
jgi:subtilase family serine protease